MKGWQARLLMGVAKLIYEGKFLELARREIAAVQALVNVKGEPLTGAEKWAKVKTFLTQAASDWGLQVAGCMVNLLIEIVVSYLATVGGSHGTDPV